jgi:hypothetical protein
MPATLPTRFSARPCAARVGRKLPVQVSESTGEPEPPRNLISSIVLGWQGLSTNRLSGLFYARLLVCNLRSMLCGSIKSKFARFTAFSKCHYLVQLQGQLHSPPSLRAIRFVGSRETGVAIARFSGFLRLRSKADVFLRSLCESLPIIQRLRVGPSLTIVWVSGTKEQQKLSWVICNSVEVF